MVRRLSPPSIGELRRVAVAAAVVVLAGCADFPAPLSDVVVVGSRYLGYDEQLRDGLKAEGSPTRAIDVHLVAVDGRVSTVAVMDPGEHALTFAASRRGTGNVPLEKTYRIVVEPCRSHWFLAEWKPGTEPDWELATIRAYAVPGCDPAREAARVRNVAAADALPDVVARATAIDGPRRPSP